MPTKAEEVAARIKQLEAQTAGLFKNSLNRTNTTALQQALANEQKKAIDYLRTQALTTRQKQQFEEQFGTKAPTGTTTKAATVKLVENLGISDSGGGGGGGGGGAGVEVVPTYSSPADDMIQNAINAQITQAIEQVDLAAFDEATRKKIEALDKEIADLQARIPTISIPNAVVKVETWGLRTILNEDAIRQASSQKAALESRLSQAINERSVLISRTKADYAILREIALKATELTDLLVEDDVNSELKAEITAKMKEIDSILNKAAEQKTTISQTSLREIGFLMDNARFKLQEEAKVKSDSVGQISNFLNDAIIRPIVNTANDFGAAISDFSKSMSDGIERALRPTEDDYIAQVQAQMKALKKINTSAALGVDLEAMRVEQAQRTLARG